MCIFGFAYNIQAPLFITNYSGYTVVCDWDEYISTTQIGLVWAKITYFKNDSGANKYGLGAFKWTSIHHHISRGCKNVTVKVGGLKKILAFMESNPFLLSERALHKIIITI